jgi:hypothetical protein
MHQPITDNRGILDAAAAYVFRLREQVEVGNITSDIARASRGDAARVWIANSTADSQRQSRR